MPMPRVSGSCTKRDHGPSFDPRNSSTRVVVHSGGLSQFSRSSSTPSPRRRSSVPVQASTMEREMSRMSSWVYNVGAFPVVCRASAPTFRGTANAKHRRNNHHRARRLRADGQVVSGIRAMRKSETSKLSLSLGIVIAALFADAFRCRVRRGATNSRGRFSA